eukprot:g4519.t1
MEQFRHHDDGDEDIQSIAIVCNTRKRYEVLLQHVHAKLLRKVLTPTQITTAVTAVLRHPVLITRPFVVDGVAQLAARLVAMEKEKQRLVESGRGANGAAPASAHANFPEMPREQMLEPHHLACCLNTMAALGVWNDEFVRAAVRCLQKRWNNMISPRHVVQCLVAVASLDGHLSATQPEVALRELDTIRHYLQQAARDSLPFFPEMLDQFEKITEKRAQDLQQDYEVEREIEKGMNGPEQEVEMTRIARSRMAQDLQQSVYGRGGLLDTGPLATTTMTNTKVPADTTTTGGGATTTIGRWLSPCVQTVDARYDSGAQIVRDAHTHWPVFEAACHGPAKSLWTEILVNLKISVAKGKEKAMLEGRKGKPNRMIPELVDIRVKGNKAQLVFELPETPISGDHPGKHEEDEVVGSGWSAASASASRLRLPPAESDGSYSEKGDVFALGAVLHQLIEGRSAFPRQVRHGLCTDPLEKLRNDCYALSEYKQDRRKYHEVLACLSWRQVRKAFRLFTHGLSAAAGGIVVGGNKCPGGGGRTSSGSLAVEKITAGDGVSGNEEVEGEQELAFEDQNSNWRAGGGPLYCSPGAVGPYRPGGYPASLPPCSSAEDVMTLGGSAADSEGGCASDATREPASPEVAKRKGCACVDESSPVESSPDFLSRVLTAEEDDRMSAAEALKHPWIATIGEREAVAEWRANVDAARARENDIKQKQ